jgi:hypothetical protein
MYYEPENAETNDCIESAAPCMMHRYNTVYLCSCGALVSHSQGDWNEHRLHTNGISIPARYWNHGESAAELFDKLQVYGLLPYGTVGYSAVYDHFAEVR